MLFIGLLASVASLSALLDPTTASPLGSSHARALPAVLEKRAVNHTEYHGLSLYDHKQMVYQLSAAGYHPTSLDVAGPASDVRYTAIWTQEKGDEWQHLPGASKVDWEAIVAQCAAQGYVPTLLSVAGTADQPVYAGVVERVDKALVASFAMHTDLAQAEVNAKMADAQQAGHSTVAAVAMFGGGDPLRNRYAVVFHQRPNTGGSATWSWRALVDGPRYVADEPQHEADGRMARFVKGAMVSRPVCVLEQAKEALPSQYVIRLGDTAQHEKTVDEMTTAGYYPVSVSTSGYGSSVNYYSIWTQ